MAAPSLRMLVADDSTTIHQVFRKFIEDSGERIELDSAHDGSACLEVLDRGDIDLAFIDLNMPNMSGLEAIDGTRSHGHRTFVTLISAESGEPNFALARQLRVYEFLRKPFSLDAMRAILSTYRRIAAPMHTH
jgi:CheY-like chemotaxis protein